MASGNEGRKSMKLRDPIGVWFSGLEDNWESCAFFCDIPTDKNRRREDGYRRYGDLPDGLHYGARLLPGGESEPELCVIQLVEETGKLRASVPAGDAGRDASRGGWPLAVTASPGGESIVWLKDGALWAWHRDRREKRFLPDGGSCLTVRIGGRRIRDARMCADGVLELKCEGGETLGYFCGGDVLLFPWEDGWTAPEKEVWRVKDFHGRLPASVAVVIRGEDEVFDYFDCGVRRVCFEAGLKTIPEGILAENHELEAVAIPAWVEQVDRFAFGCCANLRTLVIEGDLSRVADWAEDAFAECPCDGYYRTLRGQAASRADLAQRIWKLRVWDAEAMLRDPELYALAKRIEASLGRRARFMLRPGNGPEIRILVEAPTGEKCLTAMLRFLQAAEKKGYPAGQAEEEEM